MAHHLFAFFVPSLPATNESNRPEGDGVEKGELATIGVGKGPVGAAPGGGGKEVCDFLDMSGRGLSGSREEIEAFL